MVGAAVAVHISPPVTSMAGRDVSNSFIDTDQGSSGLTPPGNPVLQVAVLSVKSGVRVEAFGASSSSMPSESSRDNYSTSSPSQVPDDNFQRTERPVHSGSLEKQVRLNLSNVSNWWKSSHELYRQDLSVWGFGFNPIFTVYEGPGGKIQRVMIDEGEIQRRAALTMPSGSGIDVQERLSLAKSIADELQSGNGQPPRNSTVYTIVKHNERQHIAGKIINQISSLAYPAAPVVKSALFIGVPIYGICVLWSAYQFTLIRRKGDKSQEEQSAARLLDLQKLKAQMRLNTDIREHKTTATDTIASDFMKRLQEVREMARKVRMATPEDDETHIPVEAEASRESDSGTDSMSHSGWSRHMESGVPMDSSIEEKLNSSDSCDNLTEAKASVKLGKTINLRSSGSKIIDSNIEVDVYPRRDNLDELHSPIACEESGGEGPRASAEATNNVPFSDLQVTGSISKSHISDNLLRSYTRVKPRIIVSLEEAKATIASKKERLLGSSINSTDWSSGDTKNDIGDGAASSYTETKGGYLPATVGSRRIGEHHNEATSAVQENQEAGGVSSMEPDRKADDSGVRDSIEGYWKDPNKAAQSYLLNTAILNGQDPSKDPTGFHSTADSAKQTHNMLSTSSRMHDRPIGRNLGGLKAADVPTKNDANQNALSDDGVRDVLGSGQPLSRGEMFSNTKRWGSALQKKYDRERDPEMRNLMREVGSGLDSWVTEEEVDNAGRLAQELAEGGEENYAGSYLKAKQKIKEQKERFGLQAFVNKYKEYQPVSIDELWWLDLRCVLCLMAISKQHDEKGLFSLDMSLDLEGAHEQEAKHIIAFEDRKDAINFCYLLSHKSERVDHAEVFPLAPKQLHKMAKQEGFKVTVLRKGQLQLHIEQSVDEIEEKILEIGRSVYWEKLERERTLDIDSILDQGFGL